MSRGLLRRARLAKIDASLPDVLAVRDTAQSLHPDTLSLNFDPSDYTPIAAVCWQDCTGTLAEIRHALFEYFAHGAFYRERKQPNTLAAAFYERYYLDDAALRLYASGEHLASGIVFMLNLSASDLQPFRTRHTSLQSTIAEYLRKKRRGESLTQAVWGLGQSDSWRFARDYRNRLVHDQPPSVHGLGIRYRRRLRWKVSADGTKRYLGLTLGDVAEYDLSTIGRHLEEANRLLIRCVTEVLEMYFSVLEAHRIYRTAEGLVIDRRPEE